VWTTNGRHQLTSLSVCKKHALCHRQVN